ncbi:signal transduction histidine kinase/predicted ATPase [Actinoplanes octamycinicus]|uniref:histidine kinase n=1 Tax=Actinoplanes octamycinicus TaxID=135948 RepID=A0A7W7GZY5_9ACTN|nr:AAA family ATPase [Actinoplanes octamycinicus]MBB4741440.1 signal transduction histidine kinase/predicted ATPase [Actinoplanes octamycinicus]GIE62763.1 hypothetical protein Aoc01nite_81650 [Actinoplanes octamycinicus]
MGDELLYRSDRTQVTRPHGSHEIHKRATGPGAQRRVEHERAVLKMLATVPGIPRLADRQPRRTLVLADDGGAGPPRGPMPPADLLRLARDLAGTLAAIHRAGVLHRDITPANLIISSAGRPVLIDFDLAVVGVPEPADGPVGTLGYLAPEQTGRTGLAVDRRADLYGLGATLYALATGTPPVPGDDPLELVRDTLLRVPPAPDLPPRLAAIVLRLLEKDPDRRYQSAEGLAHDLDRCVDDPDGAGGLGERDFPAFLPPPAELVGRDPEIGLLDAALDRAMVTGTPPILVTGPPGIGKSALVRTLRPRIAERGGWFVAGKYDQFRTGTNSGGIARMLRALARLLLAEPERRLAEDRARILAALGPNAPVLVGAIPELGALLGGEAPAGPGDPLTAPARLSAAVGALLRAVAAGHRLVVLVDDLQWASSSSLRIFEGILADQPITGLLLVGTFREGQLDPGRWQRDGLIAAPIRLAGLDRAGLAALTGAVLRLPVTDAAGLAELIGAAGGGNPYATVELINAVRAAGLLTPDATGWRWDPDAVRGFVAQHELPRLLAVRLGHQPPVTRLLLAALTCLGAEVRPELFAAATAADPAGLAPAAAAGLISVDGVIRFRHDLVSQAARELLPAADLDRLQLAMARRLAGYADFEQEAAEQYLAVTGLIGDEAERRTAAGLLHRAGRRTTGLTNYLVADELLAAAERLCPPVDRAERDAIAVDRHAALYCLGRHADADRVYRDLVARSAAPLTLAGATAVQINSLTQRGEARAAIALGLDALRRFGVQPPADLPSWNRRAVVELRDRLARAGPAYPDVEATDPRIRAVARIVHRLTAPAFLIDPDRHTWLVLQAHELWQRYGVCAPLTGTLGSMICVTVALFDDYRTGYLLTQQALAAARRHGYQQEGAVAGYLHLLLGAHWFEPLEEIAEPARQARDDLLEAGDVQVAGLHWARMLALLFETEDSLETSAEETAAVLAFAERTGNRYARLIALAHQQLIQSLRASPDRTGLDLDEIAGFPPALATYHQTRALAALLNNDPPALREHAAAIRYDVIRGFYASALARVARCLSTDGCAPADRDWLARRAADAPRNFRPLLLLVDAEAARARGDRTAATRLFDEALHETGGRPWQHALLAERAGRHQLDQGLTHAGRRLLAEARDAYRAWGADGPVARLHAEHPFLRAGTRAAAVGADRLDLMAILRASRALSSQTTLAGLKAQVGDVLSAITGATDVRLALRDQVDPDVPMSAVRYVRRTHQPLLVADATGDDRFAGDRYFAGLDACSLLVLPVTCHNAEDAVLVLANQRQPGVFSTSRLEAVELIAGQLAVSLDNALVHESLESEVRARTAELADRNRELKSANQLKADLIGMLGHEINNPLGTILGSLDLVLTGDPLPPSAEQLLTRVRVTTLRLTTIVDEVLALVSIDAGRITAAPRPIRIADHIASALTATASGTVPVCCPPDLVATAQPSHVDQILTNLISNAAKYGGGVSAITAHGTTAGPVTVEVSDHGPGVPPDFRDHLFDRFSRAAPTATQVPGTGLGLYIVRELARANHGDVAYHPAPDHGSTFTLTLPAP